MSWSDKANSDMQAIKAAFGSSDAEMQQLHAAVQTWAHANQNGHHRIPFGKFRNSGVTMHVTNGEITGLDYGDN